MKRALFIFSLFLSQISFCQNGMTEHETEMTFVYPDPYSAKQEITIQKGKPKKLDFEGTVYFNPGDHLPINKDKILRIYIPATKFYFQKADLKIHPILESDSEKKVILKRYLDQNLSLQEEIIDGEHYTYQLPREKLEDIYRPFYFKKHEVTNGEYWEFIYDVAEAYDSSVKYQDMTYILVENGEAKTIPIYPDTACWIKDANYSYNEPFTRGYFIHDLFQDYPIVGVNYYQAKAFCHWKTKQLQESLGKKHQHLKLKVDLPTESEWEWMAIKEEGKFQHFNITFLSDFNWMLDLVINYSNSSKRNFNNEINSSIYYKGGWVIDGSFFTHGADLEDSDLHEEQIKRQKKAPHEPSYLINLDASKTSGMGDNVSEWLRETYSENWELMFQRQLKLWEQANTPESLLLKQIALYHDSHADKDGQLVKGANWLDERFSNIMGKNKAGIHAKTFVSPSRSHSTLGFRYVIYFSEK